MDWLVPYLDPEKIYWSDPIRKPDPQRYSLCSCRREGPWGGLAGPVSGSGKNLLIRPHRKPDPQNYRPCSCRREGPWGGLAGPESGTGKNLLIRPHRNRIRNTTPYVLVGERDLEVDWLVPNLDLEIFIDTLETGSATLHTVPCSCWREGPWGGLAGPVSGSGKIYGSDHIRNRIRNNTAYVLVGERDLEVDWLDDARNYTCYHPDRRIMARKIRLINIIYKSGTISLMGKRSLIIFIRGGKKTSIFQCWGFYNFKVSIFVTIWCTVQNTKVSVGETSKTFKSPRSILFFEHANLMIL